MIFISGVFSIETNDNKGGQNRMNWHQAFSVQILNRGLDYHHRELVKNIDIREDFIEASVYGSHVYDVKIKLKDREITNMKCDCLYAYDGDNCKHMAAVLFCADDEEPINKEHSKKIQNSLVNLVKEADEAIIRDFLTSILINDEKLLNRFKSVLKCEVSPEDMKRYKNYINKIFNRHAGLYGFIDYHSAGQFATKLEEFLNNETSRMVENEQYHEAFELTNYIFIKLGNQDIDDSDGETEWLTQECIEIWQAILKHSDELLKKKMFRWFIENINESVVDYMEEYLEDILFENFKEEAFLAEKLIFTDKQVRKFKKEEDSWSRGYAVGKWAIRHIAIMEEQHAAETTIDEYCEKHLEFNKVRQYYIERCMNRKAYDKAIFLLEEGKQVSKDLFGIVRRYSLQFKNIYRQTGNNQGYKKELWSLILEYQQGDLDIFNELKALYSEEAWKKQREIIFKKISPYSGIADLYESEKLYDRLLQVVLESPNLYPLKVYEKSLIKLYPQELLKKYEMVVRGMASHTSTRKRYQEIVTILRRMQKYPGGKQKVEAIVNEWHSIYRNRRAMMDELSKL